MPNKTTIIYHGHCDDGFGSALACHMVLGDSAQYVPRTHRDGLPDGVQGRDVRVFDFSFSLALTEQLHGLAASLEVHDHHETAKNEIGHLPYAHFSSSRAGTGLAWTRYHGDAKMPDFLAEIEQYDLDKKNAPIETKLFIRALRNHERSFLRWAPYLGLKKGSSEWGQIVENGRQLNDVTDMKVERLLQRAKPITLAQHTGLSVMTPFELAEDVAVKLANESGSFGAAWYMESTDRVRVSLRTVYQENKPLINVAKLAENFAGGGHAFAAGFSILPALFFKLFPAGRSML